MVNTVVQLVKNDKIIKISYIIAFAIFLLSFLMGYLINNHYIQTNETYTVLDIFLNNTIISSLQFIGILSFGLINIFMAIINGYTIGSIINYATENYETTDILLKLLPHGIFEIPSLIISTSVGFLPLLLIIKRAHSSHRIDYKSYFRYILFSFCIVILLNVIASIIEVNISM